jgi:two-component system, chemotaxis family, CheB/CheR fusion protein
MPADTGAAFVLVQHLAPHHESMLSEILARHTSMVLAQVVDEVRVEPNHVYSIPPNTTLTFAAGRLHLAEASETRRVPIDGFFTSLAASLRDHAVGIILSGAGSDGALGIQAIKEHGGMTMAQEPESARFDSMPRSAIATLCVDHVLRIEEMPAALIAHLRRLAAGVRAPDGRAGKMAEPVASGRRSLILTVCAILQQKTGHDFSRYKESSLGRRLARRMEQMQLTSPEAYLERLRGDPGEVDLLLKDLLINVTQFFRDPEVFAVLGREVVPRLFDEKRETDVVRVWIAGCASGEEAYSIAMLLEEHVASLEAPPEVKIFATDIDEEALAEARQGRYSAAAVAPISPERLARFFNREGDVYEVKKTLRDMCVFAKHNLVNNPPFSRLDLISCRNTLIYLRGDLQNELLALLHYALRPGGHLLLGPAESVAARTELFRAVSEPYRIFRRREPVIPPVLNFPLGEPNLPTAAQPFLLPEKGRRTARAVERLLLEKFVPASVVVGERGEVLYLAGPTRRYLEQPAGAPTLNLVDLAHPELRLSLRGALREALATHAEVVRESVSVGLGGELRQVDISVRPMTELGADPNALLVVFSEKSGAAAATEPGASPRAPRDEPMAAQLEREMERTRMSLLATIDDRQASNEQLQTANEELLSMNEEMASTNEEMQTSREEMQSINEELQTLTAELRHRIAQLDAANGDLRNIFASTHIATVFLDARLRIKRFTPAATELFRLVETDVDRELGDIMPRFAEGDLMAAVGEVVRTLEPQEREVHRREGDRWYAQRVQPYRTVDNLVDGVVITFIDITDRKRSADALEASGRRKNEFLAMLAHELRNPLVPIRNAAHLLRRHDDVDPDTRQAHDTIDRQVGHMVRMIDDLLDVSRVDQGKIRLERRLLDLVELVRTVVEDARGLLVERGLTVELSLPDAPLPFTGDVTRLSQVVGNLLDNAGKFTDAGGTIRVALGVWDDRTRAVLVVDDTGIGMDAETLPRIFDIFDQADRTLDRSRGGIGLGLSLVKGLIVQHGGSVRAESEGVGRGSRFVVELPLDPNATAPEPKKPVTSAAAPVPPRRILVIEDSEDAAVTMKLVLQRWGHQVEVAREGSDALVMAKQSQPEIVFCDIGLPGDLDGYEVAKALRADAHLRSAYLVALTGYGRDEDKARAAHAGFDAHVTKPASHEALRNAIAQAGAAD